MSRASATATAVGSMTPCAATGGVKIRALARGRDENRFRSERVGRGANHLTGDGGGGETEAEAMPAPAPSLTAAAD